MSASYSEGVACLHEDGSSAEMLLKPLYQMLRSDPGSSQDQVHRTKKSFDLLTNGRPTACSFVYLFAENSVASIGFEPASDNPDVQSAAAVMCKEVVAMGCPLVICEAFTHPLVQNNRTVRRSGVVSFVGAPVRDRSGNIIAVVCVVDAKSRQWSEDEILFVMEVAAAIHAHQWQGARSQKVASQRPWQV